MNTAAAEKLEIEIPEEMTETAAEVLKKLQKRNKDFYGG